MIQLVNIHLFHVNYGLTFFSFFLDIVHTRYINMLVHMSVYCRKKRKKKDWVSATVLVNSGASQNSSGKFLYLQQRCVE